ncbi:hypothetical protein HYPSUDRAFT_986995 [Hypholoma sublateritium FD-334 SS-4]|uniref:GYF domain-containing protein n=1 Tax=Hypholoma sublateritium (strain FD-334 SS-4) TaxID=945553 RepID=A0A0D2LHL1_HYPSF|nr:hypothetical protein HYPSUDRAFT_986995 [Hypholoma sublateritium FD-334 SS-4]
MASRGGKKRAATQNAEPSTSRDHASKKTRFVEPAEDPAFFADQVDAALEESSRKGRVKNEGYDSDSTDDGEGVVPSRKKGDDDIDDMFAVDTEEPAAAGGTKEEKYMRLADIEGQEFGGESDGDGSDGDDSPEDEDDAERKKKEGMGFELSSFNMREEMEEGKFTEDGSYVRTVDPHGMHDRWMEGLDEREIKLARRRKREQEKKQKERILAEEEELKQSGGKTAWEKQLLPLLKKGESILEALQRLGSKAKKTQTKKSKQKTAGTDAMDVDKSQNAVPTDIETITHLASNLMSLGDTDVYSKTYEELVRSVRSSAAVEENWEPPSADVEYEYKWSSPDAGQTEDTFGPFGEEDIKSWYNAAYFGPAGEKIKIRRVGQDWGDWKDVVQ